MSLDFTFPDTDEFKQSEYGYNTKHGPRSSGVHPVSEVIIFATMSVGLGAITEANADEFYARMTIVHKCHDIHIREEREDGEGTITRQITPAEIKAHVGLTTNVSNETRAQWAKRMFVGAKRPAWNDVSITSDLARSYNRTLSHAAVAESNERRKAAKDTVSA